MRAADRSIGRRLGAPVRPGIGSEDRRNVPKLLGLTMAHTICRSGIIAPAQVHHLGRDILPNEQRWSPARTDSRLQHHKHKKQPLKRRRRKTHQSTAATAIGARGQQLPGVLACNLHASGNHLTSRDVVRVLAEHETTARPRLQCHGTACASLLVRGIIELVTCQQSYY